MKLTMQFRELFPLQVVINLDKRTDRLKACTEEFKKIGLHPVRKAGIIPPPENMPNKWWQGAVGCMASHVEVLQGAHALGTNVFIFEDDISFIPHKNTTTFEHLQICADQLSTMEWDMFYIAGNLLKPCYQVTSNLAKLTHCQSTCAYGVNKNFIPTLLQALDLRKITKPIDMVYADDIIPNHNCFISIPMLGIQRDSFSDIEGVEVKYSDYLEKRYEDNLKWK